MNLNILSVGQFVILPITLVLCSFFNTAIADTVFGVEGSISIERFHGILSDRLNDLPDKTTLKKTCEYELGEFQPVSKGAGRFELYIKLRTRVGNTQGKLLKTYEGDRLDIKSSDLKEKGLLDYVELTAGRFGDVCTERLLGEKYFQVQFHADEVGIGAVIIRHHKCQQINNGSFFRPNYRYAWVERIPVKCSR